MMQKLTVTIDSDSHARLLIKMLHSLNFVTSVEPVKSYNDEISPEELQILEERWHQYKQNPKSGKSWQKVKSALIKKHGF